MTFGSKVYVLDSLGNVKWEKDLHSELSDAAQAYMAPILAGANGDGKLEIVAMTNGGENDTSHNGIVFALDKDGNILGKLDMGQPRYRGEAMFVNVNNDPYMELVLSGSAGLDVIETNGYGPNTEQFQRRRGYDRNGVVPWANEDSYFINGGKKNGVANRTDNLVLAKAGECYQPLGSFITDLLTLPPTCAFDLLTYDKDQPDGTSLVVNIFDELGNIIMGDVLSGTHLHLEQPVSLEFLLSTANPGVTPLLDFYSLSFVPAPEPSAAAPLLTGAPAVAVGLWQRSRRNNKWQPLTADDQTKAGTNPV